MTLTPALIPNSSAIGFSAHFGRSERFARPQNRRAVLPSLVPFSERDEVPPDSCRGSEEDSEPDSPPSPADISVAGQDTEPSVGIAALSRNAAAPSPNGRKPSTTLYKPRRCLMTSTSGVTSSKAPTSATSPSPASSSSIAASTRDAAKPSARCT